MRIGEWTRLLLGVFSSSKICNSMPWRCLRSRELLPQVWPMKLAASASPGSLLEMHSLGPHPDRPNRNLHLSKIPRQISQRSLLQLLCWMFSGLPPFSPWMFYSTVIAGLPGQEAASSPSPSSPRAFCLPACWGWWVRAHISPLLPRSVKSSR